MKTETFIKHTRWRKTIAVFMLLLMAVPMLPAKAQMMYEPQNEGFSFPSYYNGGEDRNEPTRATITFCDGATSSYYPFHNGRSNYYEKIQFIIPNDEETSSGDALSSLSGATFTGFKFYTTNTNALSSIKYQIYLGKTSEYNYSATSTASSANSKINTLLNNSSNNNVLVYEGTVSNNTSNKTVTVNFNPSSSFVYDGSNLLVTIIRIEKTSTAPTSNPYFTSKATSSNQLVYVTSSNDSYNTTGLNNGAGGGTEQYLPKITITYNYSIVAPTISLAEGAYNSPQEVTLSCSTEGASIYYTIDGSQPSASHGTLYEGAFTIGSNCTLKAISVKGSANSGTSSATYTFQPLPPVITNAGVYGEPVNAVITAADEYTSSIYYTTDGTEPSATNGTLYTEPFLVSSKTTVKAVAIPNMSGWENSEVATDTYIILNPNGMSPDDNPTGLVMSKSFANNGSDNNSGTLTLESFVTGSSITISNVIAPTDIVLVLDVSSSMANDGQHADIPSGSGNISRMAAMKNAVDNFLTLIKDSGNQPDATVYPGMHHRISFVTYGSTAKLWNYSSGTMENPGYWVKSNLDPITQTSYFTNAFYDVTGTTYKTAWDNIYMAIHNGDGNTELEYAMPIVKRLFDKNSNEISGVGTRNRLVVIFTDGGIGGGQWGGVNGDVNATNGLYYAEGKANYTLNSAYELKNSYDAKIYSVGLFPNNTSTNTYPTVSFPNYNHVFLNGTAIAPTVEGNFASYPEYSQAWAQNASRFMALRSSNYPFATSMTNSGFGSNNRGYFLVANTSAALANAFETISQTIATPSMSLSSQTVVEDVISDAFMLPEGVDENDILVYTAKYTGGSYNWAARQSFTGAQVSISGKRVCVSNFDFSENWVGMDGTTAHGYKLIIEIPIERDYTTTAAGGASIKTNGDDSGIYGDDCDQVGAFLSPVVSLDPTSTHLWTEFINGRPATFPDDATIAAGGADYYIPITCEEDLAWFISYVNGLNGCSAHSAAKAKLTADLDMSGYVWVPIGRNSSKPFQGIFDGQYHTIDGIHIANATEIGYVEGSTVGTNGPMKYTGMFGYVEGDHYTRNAVIRNTFITSGSLGNGYYTSDTDFGCLGGLVGCANNNTEIDFCETSMTLTAIANTGAIGGIVGFMSGTGAGTQNSWLRACASMCNIDCNGKTAMYAAGVAGWGTFNGLNPFSDCFANCTITDAVNVTTVAAVVGYANQAKNLYAHPSSTGATVVDGYQFQNNVYAVENGGYSYAKTFSTSDYRFGVRNNLITDSQKSLVDTLNDNVVGGYKWVRAAGSSINGGYPIVYPVAADSLACVSLDGKVLRFGELNAMIAKYKNVDNAEIFMYNNDIITEQLPASAKAKLYIDENVALKQTVSDVNAIVSITLTNKNKIDDMTRDWHMFATSLADAPLGINEYNQTATGFDPNDALTLGTDYKIDPAGYFPANIGTSSDLDFYSFYEPQYHWINLKRASNNHYHQDEVEGDHPLIHYYGAITEEGNEDQLIAGKGYLVALGNKTTANSNLMQAEGLLNNGAVNFNQVTARGGHLNGYNLLGNPYQSYLDFNEFASVNEAALWGAGNTGATGYKAYLIYDAKIGWYDEYLVDDYYVGFSQGAERSAKRYLNMHQGFFVVKLPEAESDSVSVSYTEAMRSIDATGIVFRNEAQPTYPLVNLFCTDSDGKKEVNVMEFERPLKAGSLKMRGLLNGKCNMWMHWNGDDLGSVFIDYMPDYVPVWFEAAEDGVFTITWSTANANFGYMHLIDNIAGIDYDCLAPGNDHYTFESHVNDMEARFRLVFKPLGIEEVDSEQNGNFAFFNGEELVVNGSGDMRLTDLNGRCVYAQHLAGQQNSVNLPMVAQGMYLLQLNGSDGVKVQKIVIRK